MYHDNRIAVFVSHLYGDYQRSLCQGVVDRAAEYGYRTEIYCSSDGEALGEYVAGEDAIVRVPDFRSVDGVVFVSGPYVDRALRDKIADVLKEQGLPVAEVTEHDARFPAVSLRNNELFRDITEHLIRVHGARRICYLGYRPQSFYSDWRLDIVGRTAAEHGLPFGPAESYACEDTAEDYAAALRHFTQPGLPDAVVCYNDHAAVRFWEAAHLAGYEIPRDFAVTGCDWDEEGQILDPPLTTATFPAWEVGAAAVNSLMEQMHGRTEPVVHVPAELVLGGSCGCGCERRGDIFLYQRKLSKRIVRTENTLIDSLHMVAELSRAASVDEGMDVLEKYVRATADYSDFYLCLFQQWDALPDDLRRLAGVPAAPDREEDVLLKLAIRDGKRLPECSFQSSQLLPDFIQRDSESAYIVSPVAFGSRAFGYMVRAFRDDRIGYQFLDVLWLTNTAQFLQNICENRRLHAVSHRLESIYAKDGLTGLYSHPGFMDRRSAVLHAVEGSLVAATIFDVDHLKAISDHFGHREGDFALMTVGQALRKSYRQEDLCARFEGDEFYVLAKTDDPTQAERAAAQVRSYLDNFNKLSAKPYLVSVSAGWACLPAEGLGEEDLPELFSQADAQLRQAKKKKPASYMR